MTQRSTVEWLMVTLLCAVLAVFATWFGWGWRIDQTGYDAAMSMGTHVTDDEITIVAIDDSSLAEIGRWPWRRSVHAALLERLTQAGARVVVLDIILNEPNPDDPAADRVLAAAIGVNGNVVLPVVQASRGNRIIGEAPPAAVFRAGAAALGHIHVEFDPDGIARSIYLWEGFGAPRYPQLALAALQLVDPASAARYPPPPDQSGSGWQRSDWLRIPFAGPPGTYRYVSYADVLRGDADPAVLRDKVVFVGATAVGMGDSVPTPTSGFNRPMPGVEVNATVYSALKRGDGINMMPPPVAGILAAAIVVGLMVLMLRSTPRGALLFAFLASAGTLLLSVTLLHSAQWWFPPFGAILGCVLCYPLWSWRRLEAAQRHLDDQLEILDRDAGMLFPIMQVHLPTIHDADPLQARIRRMTQAVQRQRDLRRFVADTLDTLPVGAVVTNSAHEVMLCNRQAMTLLEANRPDDVAHALAALDWSLGTGDSEMPVPGAHEDVVTREIDAPGGARLLVSVSGLANAAGVRIATVLGIADITRIHEAQRSREETMHYLSHDLRSPLASILTLIEAERISGDVPPSGQELLRQLNRYANSALKLADDLFRLVRAESIDAASFREFSLVATVQDAADEVWVLARARSVQVIVRPVVDDEEACYVRGDRDLVRRALVNLLGNAIKYGPSDSEVMIAIKRDGDAWAVSVTDQGEGIRQELLPRLFRRFGRLPTAASRREAGLGLGLMIVKTVAERHGGHIHVDSTPGEGSTFTLSLPVVHVESAFADV